MSLPNFLQNQYQLAIARIRSMRNSRALAVLGKDIPTRTRTCGLRCPPPSPLHLRHVRHATTALRMPAMSPTMTEGGITGWKMKEGDTFAPGDVILELVGHH